MPGRIIVFGATGYTGRLTAERLVEHGVQPVLAGRSEDRLRELAGPLALEAAGAGAVRVDIGCYALGGGPGSLSSGTKASMAGVALDPSFAFRGGRLVRVRSAERVRSFDVRGKPRPAISVGGAEHFGLPAAYPRLREVNVYLGWFGPASRVTQASSAATAVLARVPGVHGLLARAGDRLASLGGPGPEPGTTPGTRSHVAGAAYDADGPGGPVTGAAGPRAACGLDVRRAGCAAAGIAPLPA